MSRSHQNSSGTIDKSIDIVLPVRQDDPVVEGQIRIRKNLRSSHSNIVARAKNATQLPISQWPKNQQPREKLKLLGAEALSDAELLAIFLRVGIKGKNAIRLAEDLLSQFGSLPQLLACEMKELSACQGIGLSKWSQIKAAYELVKRSLEKNLIRSAVLTSSSQAKDLLQAKIAHLPHEVFVCLYLDSCNRLIECQTIFRGSIAHTAVYPREIIKESLARNASALIVAHNHPSGSPLPSKDDENITDTLSKALSLVDIHLLDHCIVSAGGFFSFADAGLMPQQHQESRK